MDHLGLVFVELGLIFVGVSLLGVVARRFGLSPIPFYLLAGLAFGEGGVAPVAASGDFVTIAAEVGVLLLLLTLGLEFSPAELSASLGRHRPSGVVDLVLNALPGFGIALVFGLPWPAAFAMAVYLPILIVVLAGGGLAQAAGGIALAVGAVTLALVAATRASHRIGGLISHEQDEQVMLRVLGLTMLVAAATHLLGASAAVGAFLVGIAIPGTLAERARDILGPQRDLFAAIFFVSFGLGTNPRDLLAYLPVAAVLALVGVLSKVATGWYAAGRDGVQKRGRLRAGLTLAPRGEFSIVIAGLAVAGGYPQVGLIATAYVLILAVLGPVLAKFADALGERLFPAPGA